MCARWCFPLLLAVSLSAAQPDVSDIIRRSVAVNESDFNEFPRYSREETDVSLKLDATGQSTTKSDKTIEVVMIDGSPYERLLKRDGQPLSTDEVRKEDEKL